MVTGHSKALMKLTFERIERNPHRRRFGHSKAHMKLAFERIERKLHRCRFASA